MLTPRVGRTMLTTMLTTHSYSYSAIAKGEEVRISYASPDRGTGAFVQNWGFVDQVLYLPLTTRY